MIDESRRIYIQYSSTSNFTSYSRTDLRKRDDCIDVIQQSRLPHHTNKQKTSFLPSFLPNFFPFSSSSPSLPPLFGPPVQFCLSSRADDPVAHYSFRAIAPSSIALEPPEPGEENRRRTNAPFDYHFRHRFSLKS